MYANIYTDGFTPLVYVIKEAFWFFFMKAYKSEVLAVWVNSLANS